jgi:XTP/dITP diphosphohydrolase
MRRLLVATRNLGKQPELRAHFAPLAVEILFPDDVGLAESPDEGGLERFDTFEENARAKAWWFAERSGLVTVADDSGIEVEALDWGPGVHTKRFAGMEGADHEVAAANNAALLLRLEGLPDEQRGARYRGVLCLVPPPGGAGWWPHEVVTEGVTRGRIAAAPSGGAGFGYDPLFWSDELGKTFGDATPQEKASVSHRARAAAALIRRLTD